MLKKPPIKSSNTTWFPSSTCWYAWTTKFNNQAEYDKHIILIGTFHLVCACMKMIGKRVNGSGLSDILLEAELMSSCSLQGVLSGKHYDRALHCLKILVECLDRLLLSQYLVPIGINFIAIGIKEDSARCTEFSFNRFPRGSAVWSCNGEVPWWLSEVLSTWSMSG